MIRLKWNSIGNFPRIKAAMAKDGDFVESIRKDPHTRGSGGEFINSDPHNACINQTNILSSEHPFCFFLFFLI